MARSTSITDAVMSPAPKSVSTIEDLAIEGTLADKYRIVRVLGRGGMGVVVEAEHVQLDEKVAIKFLIGEHTFSKEARDRFTREGRAVVKLRSEHVTRVRDVGELSTGQPYIVMELMVGQDLAHTLDVAPPPPAEIVDLMLQACEALAEAHASGIVHRDIKPANMFVTHTIDGVPHLKLFDFGVATGFTGDQHITSTGIVVGTPAFMCPEQMRSSRQAEPRWDLWSLGVVMYEAIEGRRPFDGEGFAETVVAVLTEQPPPMRRTPDGLEAVILRCLEKDPEARFQSAAELAVALAPFAHSADQAKTSVARTARTLRKRADSAPSIGEPRKPRAVSPIVDTELASSARMEISRVEAARVEAARVEAARVEASLPDESSLSDEPLLDDPAPAIPERRNKVLLALIGVAMLMLGGVAFHEITSSDPETPLAMPPNPPSAPSAPHAIAVDAALVIDAGEIESPPVAVIDAGAPSAIDATVSPTRPDRTDRTDRAPTVPRTTRAPTPDARSVEPDGELTDQQLMERRN
jgi:eukaryotic-like serine/threonine-protein kinase